MSRWFRESQRPAAGNENGFCNGRGDARPLWKDRPLQHVNTGKKKMKTMSATIKKRWRNGWKTTEELKRAEEPRQTAYVGIYGWFHEGPATCRRFTCVVLMASVTLMRSLWMSLCQWRRSWPLQSDLLSDSDQEEKKPLNLWPLIITHTLHNYMR